MNFASKDSCQTRLSKELRTGSRPRTRLGARLAPPGPTTARQKGIRSPAGDKSRREEPSLSRRRPPGKLQRSYQAMVMVMLKTFGENQWLELSNQLRGNEMPRHR